MRELVYSVMDPTGNVTALAETAIPVAERAAVAAQIMDAEPSVEQVGFLSEDGACDLALAMAGGEFCGNAAMSAAAWFADRQGALETAVRVRVSGARLPVEVALSAADGGARRGALSMPPAQSVRREEFPDRRVLDVVRMEGITHIILPGAADRGAEAYAADWCRHLGAEALGLMFLELEERRLTPLVYVPAAGTLVWESACASGTAAVGAYLARERGSAITAALRQPGGTLTIDADPEGGLRLQGTVRNLGRRALALPLRK